MSAAQTAARQANAAKGREVLALRRANAVQLKADILSLRAQVAEEMAKARFSAGANLRLGDIDEEYQPDLRLLHNRIRTFDRMINDPIVRGQIRAITMTMISGIRYKVEGGSEKTRELVSANLLHQGPRKYWSRKSWLDFLYEAMGFLVYGFSMFGKTRAVVDGRMVFADLTWLHPRSVDENGWICDEADELIEVRRTFQTPDGRTKSREPIPARDLFIMAWDRRGPNWEGNAFIRPMFRPWVFTESAEKIDMIDLQNRGVGIPVAHLSGAGGVKERDTLIEILKSLRGGSKQQAFIVLEKEEKVGYLLSEGEAKDAATILDRQRLNSVKAAGTEYFEQGNTASGSRAGASALGTGFFVNVNAINKILLDMINEGIGGQRGLAQELAEENEEDAEDLPRIVGSQVSPTEQLDNIPLIQDSVAKGLVPPHRKLANEALRRLGWPELTEEEYAEGMAAKMAFSPAVGGPGRPTEAGPDAQGRDDAEGGRLAMAQKKTSGASLRTRSPASWPWLASRAG